jgi:hypothetical protein
MCGWTGKSRAEQSRAEQSRAEQSRAEQSRAEQSRAKPVFAELLILNLLKEKLWDGVWVSSYGGTKYLGEMPRDPRLGPSLKLPAEQKRRLESQCWGILSHSEQFYTDVLKY